MYHSHSGTIAYIGKVAYAPGDFVGVILDEEVGKNNGECTHNTAIRDMKCYSNKG